MSRPGRADPGDGPGAEPSHVAHEFTAPSHDDPVIRAGSAGVGGPAGARRAGAHAWWTPLRVVLALATLAMVLGVLERGPCRDVAWPRSDGQQFARACYSDIPHLFRERGFADGAIPYLDAGDYPKLEYPVLTGAAMWISAEAVNALPGSDLDSRAVRYYDVNALLLGLAALLTVAAVVRLAGRRRPWDAALVAASPLLVLHATINWDLLAVALTTLAMLAWARSRIGTTGMLLGLAVATKLYAAVLLLPFALLCLRAGTMRAFGRLFAAAAASWTAVNLPVALAAPEGWWAFYEFNLDRGADFGSVWFALARSGHAIPELDLVVTALTLAGFAAIAWLALRAPRRPRLAQLAFLAVAVFVITNKVWSPQYALWLLPLAALARPRWRDLGIWQATEVVYFFAVWLYLLGGYDQGLSMNGYTAAILLRLGGLAWLVAVVVRDVLDPRCDPVRADGVVDDPAGGPCADRPDRRARATAGPPGASALAWSQR
ncbi:MAG: glycosyltransferase family 87 protein [Sporichthyaceae bacterium]